MTISKQCEGANKVRHRTTLSPHPEVARDPAAQRTSLRWWQGWLPLVVLPWCVVFYTPATWPRWAFMWILALAIFVGCKWLTWRRTPVPGVSFWKSAGYLGAWPGLDAASFLNPHSAPSKPTPREWLFAGCKFVLGVVLLFGIARRVPAEYPYLVGWVGMVGIVMMLHFGIFHLLSCAWRRAGVEARPLMDRPLMSVSLGEFWGRRWNTAFRDLTHRFLFRPLKSRLGARGAVFAGFAFSGVIHDVVISLPAGGGYGGPTVFFLLQGVGLLIERSRVGRSLGLGTGWRGWLFTWGMLLLPAPILFHEPFVTGIVVPFMRALGAI